MPDHLGDDMRKIKDTKEEPEKEIKCEFFFGLSNHYLLLFFCSS